MVWKKLPIALVAAVLLVGCGSQSRSIPDDLVGVWRTTTPTYADRSIEFTRTTITFGTGNGGSYTRTVVAVEKSEEQGEVLYTVSYRDPGDAEGRRSTFAFYYDPANAGAIRWNHRPEMVWTKEGR